MLKSKTTPTLDGVISKIFNRIRPQQINIKIDGEHIIELPFGWGEGEPPTPEDEDVKTKKKIYKKSI
tara:strand:+ start:43078 stop:43278 length:201 start_codon:yes stop_codon:yes gene_type:complete